MTLTPHQRRALNPEHHIAVTANAGAGKTRVLVERYCSLVMAGVPLGEVVAVTYTEKAAAELKRKIAERIRTEISAGGDTATITFLEAVRDGLPAAVIGTIHSFCARLLHEFPVESGVDASFTVMEKVDSDEWIREAVNGTLRSIISGGGTLVSRAELLSLVRAVGRTGTVRALVSLIGKREALGRLEGEGGLYRLRDDSILERWRKELEEAVRQVIDAALKDGSLEKIIGAATGRNRAIAVEALHALGTASDLRDRCAAWESLMTAMFTADGHLRKAFFGSGNDGAAVHDAIRRVDEWRRSAETAGAFVAAGSPTEAHRDMLRATRIILAVTRASLERYDARKEEEARLDFDDLQIRMRALLGNEDVRAQLSRRYRFIMVDEYQDTNTLQAEILLPILEQLARGNLFIVGDPKQSIYGFREADVRAFERMRGEIAASGGEGSVIALRESFRPLRNIAAFTNTVFSRLMAGEHTASAGGAPYEPLVVARDNAAEGRVEILLAGGPGREPIDEPELIARRILALRREQATVFGPGEQPHPVTFRDIALLLRTRNGLEAIEEALVRNGIPYAVSGGVGYYQTQDIYDAFNYLRFLLNPADDIALAGILRSPYFTVSDAELFQLSRERHGSSLWDALTSGNGSAVSAGALRRAAALLADDLSVSARLPVPELLARIMRRTNVAGALEGTVRGAQAIANLGKLASMARSYESQGFTDLFDFVARLTRLISGEEREGQAAIESANDAVQIMTVHAAKGLEFPVVIIPRLHAGFPRDREPYLDENLGIAIRPSAREPHLPAIADHIRQRGRRERLNEERRVLYVACTRARDMLILSADEKDQRNDPATWLEWLRSGLALSDPHADHLALDATTIRYRIAEGEGEHLREHHVVEVPIIRALPPEPRPVPAFSMDSGGQRLLLDPVISRSRGEIFSASKIRTYVECPARYYHRYVLGLHVGAGPFARGEPDEERDGDYPAELRGRIVHAVMEEADRLSLAGTSIDDAVRTALARNFPGSPQWAILLDRDVTVLVRSVLASAAWPAIAAGQKVKTEFSISAALGEDFITGTIDRLYRDAGGTWTVLDYKTDHVTAADVPGRANLYWPQLSFYAVMVRRLFEVSTVRTRILFTSLPDMLIERTLDARTLGLAEEEVVSVIGRIRAGEFPSPSSPCPGCPFPAGKCRVPATSR